MQFEHHMRDCGNIRDRTTSVQHNPAFSFDSDSLNSGVLKLNNLWAAAQKEG